LSFAPPRFPSTPSRSRTEDPLPVRAGDRAPGFSLPSRPGERVDLAEHLGRDRVVLLFFPLAYSSVCTTELCAIRDRWSDYEGLDARVFGISVDSPFVTERFRRDQRLPFPLLSDFNRDVSRAYGVLYDEFYGLKDVAKRAVFVIGADGVVRMAWVSEDADTEPDYEAIHVALATAP